jgi:hypothetical protein
VSGGEDGSVYLIHFARKIGNPDAPKGQAQHYIGHTGRELAERQAEELGANAPAILRAVNDAGIEWHVVRTWPGTRDTERQLKLMNAGNRLCPECTEHPLSGAGAVARAAALRRHREAQAARAQRQEARLETQRADQARQREAARAAAEADPYEDGQRMARQWLARQDEAGRTADQIEAAHEYVTGPWAGMAHRTEAETERYRGYTELVRAALAEFREYEAVPAPQHDMEAETGPAGPAGNEMEEQMQEYDADAAQYEPSPYDLGASDDPDLTWGQDADQDPESDGLDGLAGIAAERAFAARLETGTPEYDPDGNPSADSDADAGQYEHDPGGWLARESDGRVLEVDADGHPGREASPDDGRPVAEAHEDLAVRPVPWVAEPDAWERMTPRERAADLERLAEIDDAVAGAGCGFAGAEWEAEAG